MNLLTNNWIPVELDNTLQRISLQQILCDDKDYKIKTFRDDMELATLQLLVSIVQVVFIPKNKKSLKIQWLKAMTEKDYQQGIEPYLNWFDLLHLETPFMQTATVQPEKNKKNWSSLQKLFVGLPEKTSSSPTSNGFFDTTEELLSVHLGDAAIALFQQATNGFSLGGVGYSVGLKGSMPLTTLIVSDTLRKSLWSNVLSCEFLTQKTGILTASLQDPTWIIQPHTKIADENAHHIGLARGLFWQSAQVKLELCHGKAIGFYKKTGTCTVKGFWLHPHTPIDTTRFTAQNPKENPYLSARGDFPLWGQMLSFFYADSQLKAIDVKREGASNALVVQQYNDVWKKGIKLAVGGYVKGGSTESLAGRKHELYSLSTDWEHKAPEIDRLIAIGVKTQQQLNTAVAEFADLAQTKFEDRRKGKKKQSSGKEAHFRKNLRLKAKQTYFNNSETIMHSVLKNIVYEDYAHYQQQFSKLAKQVFEQIVSPYEHEDKMLELVLKSRAYLNKMLYNLTQQHGVQNV
jgi:CRISPR system Cascade subunit CasA